MANYRGNLLEFLMYVRLFVLYGLYRKRRKKKLRKTSREGATRRDAAKIYFRFYLNSLLSARILCITRACTHTRAREV